MNPYVRRGRKPPPKWALALMVMPFAMIDTFAGLFLVLGVADLVIHAILWWARRQ